MQGRGHSARVRPRAPSPHRGKARRRLPQALRQRRECGCLIRARPRWVRHWGPCSVASLPPAASSLRSRASKLAHLPLVGKGTVPNATPVCPLVRHLPLSLAQTIGGGGSERCSDPPPPVSSRHSVWDGTIRGHSRRVRPGGTARLRQPGRRPRLRQPRATYRL